MTCPSTREGIRCLHTEPHLLHTAQDPHSPLNIWTWEDPHLAWPMYPFLVGVALLILALGLGACAPTHPEVRHFYATTSTVATTTTVAPTTSTVPAAPVPVVPRASRSAARPRVGEVPGRAAPPTTTPDPSAWRTAGASWYGPGLYGNGTACGQRYDDRIVGVAHRSLPCGTVVTFEYGGRVVSAPVIDRGPFVGGRTWDLSAGLCRALAHCFTGPVNYRIG